MRRLLASFPGIAPRMRGAAGEEITFARSAANTELYGGTIRPMAGDESIVGGHTGEIVYFGKYPSGSWVSGAANYLQWDMDGIISLFYLRAGAWRRRVGANEYDFGLNRPGAPVLTDWTLPRASAFSIEFTAGPGTNGVSFETGDYKYAVTFSVVVDGAIVESEYTEVGASMSTAGRFKIYQPALVSGVTDWNIYRWDAATETFKLVATMPTGTTSCYDSTPTSALGRTILENRPFEDKKLNFEYSLTWVRNTGGYIHESGPALTGVEGAKITVNGFGVKISRPGSVPAGVTHWKIYRISTGFYPTTAFQLVAEVPIATMYYEDYQDNKVLGEAIPTYYTTSSGVPVVYGPPPVVFDGLYGPHYGMMVGWKDSTLYFSEINQPDAWPEVYTIRAAAKIVGVGANGTELLVVTTAGAQRLIGSDPLNMAVTGLINDYGGISRRLVLDYNGSTIYMARNHLISVQGSTSTSLTDAKLGSEFLAELDVTNGFMAHNDSVIHLFHAAGRLIIDMRIGQFMTGTLIYTSAYRLNDIGQLCVLRSGSIKSLATDTANTLSQTYETCDLLFGSPMPKRFRKFFFGGVGTVTAEIFVDGVSVVSKTLDLEAMTRDAMVVTPRSSSGRAVRVKITGSGEVKEIQAEVFSDAEEG